jgi:signal transduction histidine kinase
MENQASTVFNDGISGTGAELMVYRDKDGLPVTYNAASDQLGEQMTPDELSMLWHEILSPLTVIKGYTSTLLELNNVVSEEQKKQYLRGIESASNRMMKILENLRDVAQLKEHKRLNARLISLPDIIQQIITEIQSQTSKHNIKITTADNPTRVRAEPDRISQVLTNLLTNAVKYSPRGGDIEVTVRAIRDEIELSHVFGDTPGISLPSIVVSVIDHGIGLPDKDSQRVFERFYRVNNEVTRNTTGSGLGLYISKIIIESHNGSIWARKNRNGGSIFSFSLPIQESAVKVANSS